MPDDALALRSAGALAYVTAELDVYEQALARLPDWRPARALEAEARWVRERINGLAESWAGKLVVAIVGPSGAGKSTLLNALAGAELSPAGLTRPTTRRVVLYAADAVDAAPVVAHLGEARVDVRVTPGARALQHLVLADTPDTNTVPENQALLGRFLETADLVLAVFPAQNPQLYDNVTFLAPYVRQLPGDAVIPVLNKVDRVPPELLEGARDDLEGLLQREWGISSQRVYAVSALASASDDGYVPDEEPLHGENEFEALRSFVFATLDRADEVVDRRLSHAEHLVGLLTEDTARSVTEGAEARQAAAAHLTEMEAGTRTALESVVPEGTRGRALDLHAAYYAYLAQRWWGPIGWLVAVWALILRGVSFLGRIGRRDDRTRSDAAFGSTGPGMTVVGAGGLHSVVQALEHRYARAWPPVADLLVQAGFDPRVREVLDGSTSVPVQARVQGQISAAYDDRLSVLARRVSAWPVQILLNAPVIGVGVWVAVETFRAFFARDYLPLEYFRHAGVVALAVWLGCFVILQALGSLALRGPLRRGVARSLASALATMPGQGIRDQLARIDALRDTLDQETSHAATIS